MNNERRKQLAEAIAKLEEAKNIIDSVREEERDAYNNLPDSLQSGEKGEKMGNAISKLDDAESELDSIIDYLNEASE